MTDINDPTILAVLAHPDDESFGMGGTLALYARRGMAVHLVCATRGEAGDVDVDYLRGFGSKAERREAELRCAAEKLGLASVHFLDYRDSGMPGMPDNHHPQALIAAPLEEVAANVLHYIRALRPQVVLTFDPIGGYKHPDHIAIHKATVQAFELAPKLSLGLTPKLSLGQTPKLSFGQAPWESLGQASIKSLGQAPTDSLGQVDGLPPHQPDKLYFHVIPKGYLRFAVRLLPLLGKDPRRLGRNGDINLATLVEEGDFPIHAVIDYRPVARVKDDASLCHASQLDGASLRRGPMRWAQVLFGQKDHFMQAYPVPKNGRRKHDLFV